MSSNRHFNQTNPCPVCGSGSKNCSVTPDGLHLCGIVRGGEEPDERRWRKLSERDGWGLYRPVEDRPPRRTSIASRRPEAVTDWAKKARELAERLAPRPELRQLLADALRLPADALGELGLIGCQNCGQDSSGWHVEFTFPERDAGGNIIGIATRWETSPPDDRPRKACIKGSQRGLTLPKDWRDRDPGGPLFIVEGQSDTLAMSYAGLCCVGRPGCDATKYLAELLQDWPADRPIVVVGENDQRTADNGKSLWPGRTGAVKVAQHLADQLKRPVRVLFPPTGFKDVRDYLTSEQFRKTPWPQRGQTIKAMVSQAEVIPPPSSAQPPAATSPDMTCLDDVAPQPVPWLWPNRLALGEITVLSGRPGAGKSFAVADIVARITCGSPWPDGSGMAPVGSAILLDAENSPEHVLVPRLIGAGADRRRVHHLAGAKHLGSDGSETSLTITLENLDLIGQALDLVPDCRLLVVDPIGSFLGGQVDAHRDNEVRSVLAPLAAMARERGVAVLLVAHTRKSSADYADDAILGSRAFSGLARQTHHLVDDPDDSERRRKLFLPGKNNLGVGVDGLAFRIGVGEGDYPAAKWELDPVRSHADDYARPEKEADRKPGPAPAKRAACERWLTELLSSGPMLANDVKAEAEKADFSAKVLRSAADNLGVVRFKGQFGGSYFWRLPNDDPVRLDAPQWCPNSSEQGHHWENIGKTAQKTPEKPNDDPINPNWGIIGVDTGGTGSSLADDDPTSFPFGYNNPDDPDGERVRLFPPPPTADDTRTPLERLRDQMLPD